MAEVPSVYFAWVNSSDTSARTKRFHLDGTAYSGWPELGLSVGDNADSVSICSNDIDGVFVGWTDTDTKTVNVVKVSGNATLVWPSPSVVGEGEENSVDNIILIKDGLGGCFVVWREIPNTGPAEVLVQHINMYGLGLWTSPIVALADANTGDALNLVVELSSDGGCFISAKAENGYYAGLVKVTSSGALWTAGQINWYVELSPSYGSIVPLSDGGCIYANTTVVGSLDCPPHIGKFSSSGLIVWEHTYVEWPNTYIHGGFIAIQLVGTGESKLLCVYRDNQIQMGIISTTDGSTLVTPVLVVDPEIAAGSAMHKILLRDTLGNVFLCYNTDSYRTAYYHISYINENNTILWTSELYSLIDGKNRGGGSMFLDTLGGVVVTTSLDLRDNDGHGLYAQRFNVSGTKLWGDDGAVLVDGDDGLDLNVGCIALGILSPDIPDWPPVPPVIPATKATVLGMDLHFNKKHLKGEFTAWGD